MVVAGFAPYSRIEKVARKSIMATVRLNLTPEFAIRSSRAGCNLASIQSFTSKIDGLLQYRCRSDKKLSPLSLV
jgi:hypothetical protein